MKNEKVLSVFLASPSDVLQERNYLEKLVKQHRKSGYRLEIKRWEKDMPTTSAEKPQEVINRLLPDCDILIGIFWSRFGSPTEKSDSGTLEEIEQFLATKRPVILYFLDKPISPTEIKPEQFQKINEFKEAYKEKNIFTTIKQNSDFDEHIGKDLEYNIEKLENRGDKMTDIPNTGKQTRQTLKTEETLPKYEENSTKLDDNLKFWSEISQN